MDSCPLPTTAKFASGEGVSRNARGLDVRCIVPRRGDPSCRYETLEDAWGRVPLSVCLRGYPSTVAQNLWLWPAGIRGGFEPANHQYGASHLSDWAQQLCVD